MGDASEEKQAKEKEEKEMIEKLLKLLEKKKLGHVIFSLDVTTKKGMEKFNNFHKKFSNLYFGVNTVEKIVIVVTEKKNL